MRKQEDIIEKFSQYAHTVVPPLEAPPPTPPIVPAAIGPSKTIEPQGFY